MDDDPEPTLDPVILESCEVSEQLASFTDQKCNTEMGEEGALEMIQLQESGDIGPAIEPESPKKSISVKDLKDQTPQTGSKTSVLRRNKWRDEGKQTDPPGNVKSSTASLRKPSRRSSQRLLGQESRRSSQQAGGQQPPLSQKPSRGQSITEADTKDATWVSQRTGKVMKCRSQQTSRVWERKALSEILCPSTEESSPSKDESGFTTAEEEFTSSGETTSERYTGQESRHSSKQLERKVSKHSSQRQRSGSRQSSQRSLGQPSTLSPKYSLVCSTDRTDTDEDITCISQRTGREMKCKTQQTSLILGSRRLSDFLVYSSGPDPQTGREEESEFSTADELISSGETGKERTIPRESRLGSKQLESKHSQQQLGRSDGGRNSLQTKGPYILNRKSSREEFTKERSIEEEPVWISQRTGREIKSKAQQTSLIWLHGTLSDILRVYSQGSEASEAEDNTEDEERDKRTEQVTTKGSHHSTQYLEAKESGQTIQQVEEEEGEEHRKNCKNKTDQAQQTDSVESIKKELADNSQQTDVFEDMKTSLVDLGQDCGHGTEQTEVQGSQHSSQESVGQESRCGNPQPERQGSQRSSQQSLRSEAKMADENASQGLSDVERESAKTDQESCVGEAEKTSGPEENTWVSRKTGRVVRNQSQQTDRSWIQYFASKSQKLKRCISQQTDESFLQRYKATKMAVREHKKSHTEPDIYKCSQCGDIYGEDFHFDLEALSKFSTMSILSTICNPETEEVENAEEQEPCTSGRNEETPETQQRSRRCSQLWDENIPVKWPDEFEPNEPSESSLLYTEGEEKLQKTYSMISFDDGIWMNRNTGKLLVSHCQQTSETLTPQHSGTALGKSGPTAEEAPTPLEMQDTSNGTNQHIQQEKGLEGQQPSGQESQGDSPQDQNATSHLILEQPTEEGSHNADDIEKLVCSRLSEATLLSVESPDMEDEPLQMYTVVSLEEEIWMNVKTGRLLRSQGQQTKEESSQEEPTEDN